jgi:uncharacterized protein
MSPSGKWAVITGASSGIGRALAKEFAAGGFNVLLTGRNEEALRHLAQECSGGRPIQADIVIADLARADSTDALISAITATPRDYEVLVNNAGFGVHGNFASTDIDKEVELLHVQLAAALKLTKAVLPGMLARRRGKILNVASVYSYAPVPLQSVYSACKAFLLSFSTSLRNELASTGVTVTAFCPGITQTEFRSRAGIAEKSRKSGITAEAAARIAYNGTLRGAAVVVPGLPNRLFVLVAKVLPGTLFTNVIRFINSRRGHHPSS